MTTPETELVVRVKLSANTDPDRAARALSDFLSEDDLTPEVHEAFDTAGDVFDGFTVEVQRP